MSLYRNLTLMGLCAALAAAQTQSPAPAAAKPAAAATAAAAKPAREAGLYGTIQTSMGPIVVKLHEKEAPITVKNFIDLQKGRKAWTDPKTGQKVRRPLFTGTTFHRVIPQFMIQAGDPAGNGTGNIGFTIPDEFVPALNFHRPGVLAMANTGAPHSGASQFFITVVATPFLNGKHTIFGQVVEGQEVADKIVAVPRDRNDKPRTPVIIRTITFERVGPAPANDPLGPARPAVRRAAPAKPGAARRPAAAAKPKTAATPTK
jgi:peptidyl-prolyl cis-trans isomerase A (cyclophilin A)